MAITAAQLQAQISVDSGDAEKKVSAFGKAFGALGEIGKTAAGVFGGNAVTGAVDKMGSAIGGVIGNASDFQSEMSGVGAVAGASKQQLQGLSQVALQLGQDTTLSGIGASDAAKAMQALAAGGVSVADIMGGAARGALLLASAGGLDVGSAADIAASAMNNFGLTGQDVTHIADLFAAAANGSSATVGDLGESMKYIGPVAHGMGLGLDETAAVLAELGSQGIKGSQAGTTLRSMLVSLANPTKKASDLMGDLGLNFFDSTGHIKSFAGISEELHTKLAGLTDQQRQAALATLFGNEALSGATVLYGEGTAGVNKYLGVVGEAGSAAANGAMRNDNFRGSLEQLKSSWETLSIKVGTVALPMLRGVVDFATNAIGGIMAFGQSVGSAFGAVGDAFGKLRSGQITLAQFIGGIEIMVTTVRTNLFNLAAAAAPYIGAFFNAIGTAIATYAPQIATQFGLWANSFVDWIQTTAIPFLAPRLQAFLGAVVNWIGGTAVPGIVGAAAALAGAITGWLTTTAIPFLQQNLPLWFGAISTYITGTALPAIGTLLQTVGTAFGDWVNSKAVPWVSNELPKWYLAIEGYILGTAVPNIASALLNMGEAFGGWLLTKAIPWTLENLPKWYLALEGWIYGTAVPSAITALVKVGLAFGDWVVTTAIPYLLENVPKWQQALGGWILNTALPDTKAKMVEIGRALGDWVTETAVPWVQQHLPEWKSAIVDYLTGTVLPEVQTTASNIGSDLVNYFMQKASDLKDQAAAEMSKVPGAILSGIGDLSHLLFNAGASLVQGFIDGINSLINSIPSIPIPSIPGIPGRAVGGPIMAGQVYVVGERGPELFVSSQAGRILPNTSVFDAAREPTPLSSYRTAAPLVSAASGGGNVTYELHFHAPVYGVNDLESVVVNAVTKAQRRGRLAG